jgi:hypothetical protein
MHGICYRIKSRTIAHRLQCIEREILELKTYSKDIKEIKEATTKPPKSWAAVASSSPESTAAAKATRRTYLRQQKEEQQRERVKYEVTLSLKELSEDAQLKLSNMPAREIKEQCQHAINTADINGPTLPGVKKLGNGNLRLECESPEEAQRLRTINWNPAFEGMQVHKPKYGIVIHAVRKDTFDWSTENKEMIMQLEQENASRGILIAKISPLRRRT